MNEHTPTPRTIIVLASHRRHPESVIINVTEEEKSLSVILSLREARKLVGMVQRAINFLHLPAQDFEEEL